MAFYGILFQIVLRTLYLMKMPPPSLREPFCGIAVDVLKLTQQEDVREYIRLRSNGYILYCP